MYKRTVHPSSSVPRPTKRRRRTATAVLAGYFDPRPERDFFTDMANSSETKNPYNSVIGHGPGIIFDVRSQEDKDAESAREHKRLLKNAKRRERDLEKRRDKDEQKFKKAQKRAERIRETAQVKSTQRTEEERNVAEASGTSAIFFANPSLSVPPLISFTRGAVTQASRGLPAVPSPLQANPSSAWSPYYVQPQETGTSSLQGPLINGTRDAPSPTVFLQSPPSLRTEPSLAPAVPSVTISTAPSPSVLLPVSPPTPSRSISSNTSRTSSKRPHTPDDDDVPPAHMHHNAFQLYSPMDANYEVDMLDTDPLESIPRIKGPPRAISSSRDSSHRSPPTAAASSGHPHPPNSPPTWVTSQLHATETQPRGATHPAPWMTSDSFQFTSVDSGRGFPAPENNATTSISHRRSALSLSSLLSPISVLHAPARAIPMIPPAHENPVVEETNTSRPDHVGSTAAAILDTVPEPSVAAASTVGSSCLSPLADASPLGGEIVSMVADEFHEEGVEDSREQPSDDTPLASLGEETVEKAKETLDNRGPSFQGCEGPREFDVVVAQAIDHDLAIQREDSPVGQPIDQPIDQDLASQRADDAVVQAIDQDLASQREDSATPETSRKDKGRASKAMLVIESEDELTEIEDLRASPPSQGVIKEETNFARPASLSILRASASRERSEPDDGVPIPGSSASPTVSGNNSASQKRKRQAARKGWKGWIEVEVEEEHPLPVRRLSLDIPPPGERRTRSGRNFDG